MPVNQSHKRPLSQYYTPKAVAKQCFNTAKRVIGSKNITEYLEPCAGTGVFVDLFDKPYIAYDIDPKNRRVKKQNFLTSSLEYKEGRLCITNPPFNDPTSVTKFFNKARQSSHYIAFILPIHYLGKHNKLGRFKLLYSKSLGIIDYDGAPVKTCFNIYDTSVKVDNRTPKSQYFEIHSIRRGVKGTHKWVRGYGNIIIQVWGQPSIKRSINDSANSIVISFNSNCPARVKQEIKSYVERMLKNLNKYFPHLNNDLALNLTVLQLSYKLKEHFPQYFNNSGDK